MRGIDEHVGEKSNLEYILMQHKESENYNFTTENYKIIVFLFRVLKKASRYLTGKVEESVRGFIVWNVPAYQLL